jgi:hypothetical protein
VTMSDERWRIAAASIVISSLVNGFAHYETETMAIAGWEDKGVTGSIVKTRSVTFIRSSAIN